MPDLLPIYPTIDGDLTGPLIDARKHELNARIGAGEITLEDARAVLGARDRHWECGTASRTHEASALAFPSLQAPKEDR